MFSLDKINFQFVKSSVAERYFCSCWFSGLLAIYW